MKFNVGDRVRKVCHHGGGPLVANAPEIGAVGEVLEVFSDGMVGVLFDGFPSHYRAKPHLRDSWTMGPWQIVRIDDFRAGSWDEICALTRGWRPGVVTCG